MPRRLRTTAGGYVYHVLNRAVGRATIFRKTGDYAAFVKVLRQANDVVPMRLLAYCLMPNHWHLVVWPAQDGELSRYMHWLTMTHTLRWHAHRHTAGTGPLYQGRFKLFPVQEDDHLLTLCRHVERNALRAGLVRRAEAWAWSSLRLRTRGQVPPWLSAWPQGVPEGWVEHVNSVETEAELAALRRCVGRGVPWGDEAWQQQAVQRLGLEATLRPRGRPRKPPPPSTA
jgi:putative transposase